MLPFGINELPHFQAEDPLQGYAIAGIGHHDDARAGGGSSEACRNLTDRGLAVVEASERLVVMPHSMPGERHNHQPLVRQGGHPTLDGLHHRGACGLRARQTALLLDAGGAGQTRHARQGVVATA